MKIQWFGMTLILALAAGTASAQVSQSVTATIPFDFHAGRRVLPAGEYTLQVPQAGVIRVRSADNKHSAMAGVISGDAGTPDKPMLVFQRYGDQYFLSQVKAGTFGLELAKSPAERELSARIHWTEGKVIAARTK